MTTATAAATAEDVAKDVTEGFGKTTKAFGTGASPPHAWIHARVAILVVGRTLLGVRKHFIGLFGLFELFFRLFGPIALIAIRVKLHRQLAISLFDVVVAGVLGNAKDFVVIALSHEVSL